MVARIFICAFLILGMISCQNSRQQAKDEIIFPLGDVDTLKLVADLNALESQSRLDLISEENRELAPVDTIELTYYFGFCDCQRWIVTDIHNKAQTEDAALDELDPRGQVEFNLEKHGYYIEAAHSEIKLNWRFEINGTTVRFIGREYFDKQLPNDNAFTVQNPPKGRVFRYYSYEVLKPYEMWGPRKITSINESDTTSEPMILTIK